MTYTLTVVTRNGKATVRAAGDVPDGTHVINGSTEPAYDYVSVQLQDAGGRKVVTASATRHKGGG